MAIKSYKICPVCNHENLSELIECEKCEADLQRVKVTLNDDNSQEEIKKEEIKSTIKLIKICPSCNNINLANARECFNCHFDLSLVIATLQDVKKQKIIKLVSDDNQCEIIVDTNYMLIGRVMSKWPYLASKSCVSRRHFKLFLFDDKLMIKNCECVDSNREVITYINDKKLEKNEKIELNNGDLIGLGGENTNKYDLAAYFKVVIE